MNTNTLLYRQIHPAWVQFDRITSQAFQPTSKDNRKLSVYDGDQIEAEDAWRHYTSALGLTSAGTVAVTVGECRENGTQVTPDPTDFDEHALIDFATLPTSRARAVSKILTRLAQEHDWQYKQT